MIETFSMSARGDHAVNEDAYHVGVHPLDASCHVCVVADGQGGRSGGREAAQLAVRAAVAAACAREPGDLLGAAVWPTLLHEVDAAVSRAGDVGFTTLVALAVREGVVAGASSGDSAAVALMSSGQQILSGRQVKDPPVGSGAAVFVPFTCKLSVPWKVLAMSDGVWKYVGWERIIELVSAHGGAELIEALCDAARLPRSGGLQDDFTVVLAEAGS